ncbi:hypothetical protein AB0B50_38940 [Streptomyces sp. NPDC041068]|uniref:hypothetical protein n=1 Tax=Streptomyces sp. NPDC041068 TaxID=3155130 RepID=UPI0033E1D59D
MRFARILSIAATAAATTMAVVGSAGTASAGTNGQQVKVSTYYSDQISVCGTNHKGHFDCTPRFKVPGKEYRGVAGYWFKGVVDIHGYNSNTGKHRLAHCTVPERQASNWKYCDMRSNKKL